MICKVMWYDEHSVIKTDNITVRDDSTEEEIRKKAYELYDGNPPSPLCYIIKLQ